MVISSENTNTTIKKFRYNDEHGHILDEGIIAVDDNENIVSVLFNDSLAHEGLSTNDFVEFLTKAGYEIDNEPMVVSEEYFKKIVKFIAES